MDSPFPGLDPYLEPHWRSVHQRLITYAGDQLQAVLPRRFRVDVEERVFVAGDLDDRTDEPVTETYLKIVDATSGNRIITAIEFLSPTNKLPGDGNDMYIRKQREYRAAGVNQVEIDLTRAGIGRPCFQSLVWLAVTGRCTWHGADEVGSPRKSRSTRCRSSNRCRRSESRSTRVTPTFRWTCKRS